MRDNYGLTHRQLSGIKSSQGFLYKPKEPIINRYPTIVFNSFHPLNAEKYIQCGVISKKS